MENNIEITIRKIRKSKNIYQNTLANMADITINHMNAIEQGKHFPNLLTAIKIADALGITLDELAGRKVK